MQTIASPQPGHTQSLQRSPSDAPARGGCPDTYPTVSTQRFRFRPFSRADIVPLTALAGEHRIADTTIGVPHPYTAEYAQMWISSHPEAWKARRALHWAAIPVGEERIVGYAGLQNIDLQRRQAELRFWVGCGVRRHENGAEWSEAVVDFALTALNLYRIYALQLERHPLGARVLSAIGMQREGLVRKRLYKGGLVEDIVCWAMLRGNWQRRLQSED
jgi:ribosomal-protein-alanine N-acetyltransferase